MRTRTADQFFGCVVKRARSTIRPVGCHCVYRVGNCEYAGAQAYLIALHPVWVSTTVVPFVVLGDYFGSALQEIYSAYYLRTIFHVPAHVAPLFFSQRPAFEQDSIGHAYLADVMKQRAVLESNQLAIIQPDLLAQSRAGVNHS